MYALVKIAPSILSADFGRLAEEIKGISNEADMVHIDVMDGSFVPNITLGQPVTRCIRQATDLPFDVHLMIFNPEKHIDSFADAGADIITVHAEASIHLHRTLQQIRQRGIKAGVAINPATPVCAVENVLHMVDMVLVMTVNPGFGGQSMIVEALSKVEAITRLVRKKGLDLDIEVDGGITDETIGAAVRAGANVFVAGSYVFGADCPGAAVRTLRTTALAAAKSMSSTQRTI
ncbi:MAG TPA: ribulose-phosphate 3-epimerase [Firmicutes bacterium]|nr:ribulose-phosphate 3-epimerase [Bacillota bacterium]HAN86654.1 ribulose-phosphate 3-epimerase [Bacillota bacterium]